jgi:glycosyltransferase involved in cell wall biosynthesis
VSAARNKGLSIAKGEYVMFVDSDDYMLPQMCEIMIKAIAEKNADSVIAEIIKQTSVPQIK